MQHKRAYKIETYFDDSVRAFALLYERKFFWQSWKEIQCLMIYDGDNERLAEGYIKSFIAEVKGKECKFRSWRDENGRIPIMYP